MGIHAQFMKPTTSPSSSDSSSPTTATLKVPHWIIWRILSAITAYFFLSLFYSLVSLAFQIPFSNKPAPDTLPANNPNAYGQGSFVVFWMLNWVGMAALGFPCENMAMVLGFPWSSLFLIFWVITNVATGFYALDLAPGFYAWGYAWPLHRSKFFVGGWVGFRLRVLWRGELDSRLANFAWYSCRGAADYSFRYTLADWT
jgi:hypothetical protein